MEWGYLTSIMERGLCFLSLLVVHVAQVQTTRPLRPTAGPVLVPGAFRCLCELHVIQSGTARRTAAPAVLPGRAHTRVRVAALSRSLQPLSVPSPVYRRLSFAATL
jgi:hypothetical protein